MKEFKIISAVALIALTASCAGLGDNYSTQNTGRISLGFAEPVASTKASVYDTSSFLLSIISAGGDTIYCGTYGRRPQSLQVKAGTYEIAVLSHQMPTPAFESPQYGDRQIVVVSNGQQANVALLCKRVNAGVHLTFTDTFRSRYPGGSLRLSQGNGGGLDYGYDETRTAYFCTGDVAFVYRSDEGPDTLFVRNVGAGQVHNLTLNASSDSSMTAFSLCVDDAADTLSQTLIVGDRFSGADGQSKERAYDLQAAAAHMGDTVWVWGYIVGGDLTASTISFKGPFEKSSNMAIADNPDESKRENCFSVELSRTAVKTALNLVDHPENIGKKVFLRGVVSSYFSLTGLKGVTDYVLQ